MSRLLDRVIAAGLLGRMTEEFRREAEVVDFSNVTEYFFSFHREAGWDIGHDFPNLAPPFPMFWMETKSPRSMVDPDGVKREFPKSVWGFECFGVPFKEGREVYTALGGIPLRSAKWILTMLLFTELANRIYGPVHEYHLPIDERGNVAIDENGQPRYLSGPIGPVGASFEPDEAEPTDLVLPALLALSFMHCRNAILIDNEPPAPLSKKHAKKTGYPLVRYKTLQIEPVKRVLAQHGKLDTEGLRNALHICRGHFKVFDERPLFGKHTGMWWWDAYVRGTGPRVVLKDYAVKPSKI